jgi:hypothetical protein
MKIHIGWVDDTDIYDLNRNWLRLHSILPTDVESLKQELNSPQLAFIKEPTFIFRNKYTRGFHIPRRFFSGYKNWYFRPFYFEAISILRKDSNNKTVEELLLSIQLDKSIVGKSNLELYTNYPHLFLFLSQYEKIDTTDLTYKQCKNTLDTILSNPRLSLFEQGSSYYKSYINYYRISGVVKLVNDLMFVNKGIVIHTIQQYRTLSKLDLLREYDTAELKLNIELKYPTKLL